MTQSSNHSIPAEVTQKVNSSASKSTFGLLARLLPFLSPYKFQFVLAGIALIIAASATLAIPLSFRKIIDNGFGASGMGNTSNINITFLSLFGISCVLAIATAARFYAVSWLGERVTTDIRRKIYSHVITQSPEFFETTQTGEVLSRLTTDTVLIQTLVGTSISMAIRNALLLAGGLVMMFVTSIKLTVLIVVLLLAVVIPIVFMGRKVRKLSRASQDRIADASGVAAEILNAIPTIQAYTHEEFERRRFANSVEDAFISAINRIRARSALTVIAILFGFGAIVFVLWLGAHAVVSGNMSGGQLGQFILYAVMVAGAIGALSEVLGDTQRAAGASERLLELLALKSPIESPANPIPLPLSSSNGASLKINDLSFAYPSNPTTNALSDISIDVGAGQTVAIVGPSGSGKTTLFQLLLRFYDPQKGSIEVNGAKINLVSTNDLRNLIGIVPQDTIIFSANAMENIRYGKEDATDEEVIAAAKLAAAHEFIERLPQGYQSFLGERGVRLSGGQRQRIAIARALLKNPPLLLLDEATSALDAESERLVQEALENAMSNRTTLVIAHRLATVKRADLIIVIEHGHIVESGTHEALIAKNSLYASLAALQFANH